ncbi:MAG: LamG domain-containing protein, partial [Sedimentisphaerales bacterium]|nr:LamG domain-containing protein [Sedimentisphaerales bacterium]
MFRKLVFLYAILLLLAVSTQARLVAHYTLESSTKDVSGFNPADGTLVGGPTYESGPSGFGQCLRLGYGKYVDCGNPDKFAITSNMTVMCWAKVNLWLSAGYDPLVTKGSATWRLQRWSTTNTMVWGVNGVGGVAYVVGNIPVNDGEWHHFAGVYDHANLILYVDGNVDNTFAATGTPSTTPSTNLWIGGNSGNTVRFWDGWIDDVRIYDTALSAAEIHDSMMDLTSRGTAGNPTPSESAQDITRDVVLSWTPGEFAAQGGTHNVFIGIDFNDVNQATVAVPLGVSVAEGLDVNNFDPGTLEFGVTYYWRVDEVNAPSSPGSYKGLVWQFTVEPYALKLPAENITATAISSIKNNDPNDTINENGLDPNHPDEHANSAGMWLSSSTDANHP